MPRKLKNNIDVEVLAAEYLSGMSTNKLSKKYECSRRAIERRLVASNTTLRNICQANKMHSDSLSSEEKSRKAEAAHDAVRGVKRTVSDLESRAASKERNPILSKYELVLHKELLSRGITAIPQKAFSKYNVDFALPDNKLIIEIFGGWHNSPKAIKNFENKSSLLFKDGWTIVVCWSAGVFDAKKVCDYIESLTLGLNDGLKNQNRHYVIRGNARPTKIGSKIINFKLC